MQLKLSITSLIAGVCFCFVLFKKLRPHQGHEYILLYYLPETLLFYLSQWIGNPPGTHFSHYKMDAQSLDFLSFSFSKLYIKIYTFPPYRAINASINFMCRFPKCFSIPVLTSLNYWLFRSMFLNLILLVISTFYLYHLSTSLYVINVLKIMYILQLSNTLFCIHQQLTWLIL